MSRSSCISNIEDLEIVVRETCKKTEMLIDTMFPQADLDDVLMVVLSQYEEYGFYTNGVVNIKHHNKFRAGKIHTVEIEIENYRSGAAYHVLFEIEDEENDSIDLCTKVTCKRIRRI